MRTIKPERGLYPLVLNWLNSQFSSSALISSKSTTHQLFSSDTSQVAARDGGFWSRPDLAAMLYSRPRFVPQWSSALFTFEVKTAEGIAEASVYEAMAHRRYANYSVLVWQSEPKTARTDRIVELCKEFGIGAVTAEDPANAHDYVVHVPAAKSEVDASVVDEFVDRRFPRNTRINIENWLAELGWQAVPRGGTI